MKSGRYCRTDDLQCGTVVEFARHARARSTGTFQRCSEDERQCKPWIGPAASAMRMRTEDSDLTHPEEIALADFDAVVPQNAVRGRGVEVEIGEG